MARLTERALTRILAGLLETPEAAELLEEVLGEQAEISSVSFEEAGVLTTNRGLVVRVGRREFQLQVLESTPSYLREGEEEDGDGDDD